MHEQFLWNRFHVNAIEQHWWYIKDDSGSVSWCRKTRSHYLSQCGSRSMPIVIFLHYWPFVRGIQRPLVDSPYIGPVMLKALSLSWRYSESRDRSIQKNRKNGLTWSKIESHQKFASRSWKLSNWTLHNKSDSNGAESLSDNDNHG